MIKWGDKKMTRKGLDGLIVLDNDIVEYLMKNLDKGLIQFRNLESEIHFYNTYDISEYRIKNMDLEEVKESFNN